MSEKYEALRHILERCTREIDASNGAVIYECPSCGDGTMYLNNNGTARCAARGCKLYGQATPRKIVAAPGVVTEEGLDTDLDRQQINLTVERWVEEGKESEERVRREREAGEEQSKRDQKDAERRAEKEQQRKNAQRAEHRRLKEQHGASEARTLDAKGELRYGEANGALLAGIAVFICIGLALNWVQRWLANVAMTPMVPAGSPEAEDGSGTEVVSGAAPKEEPFYLDWARGFADFLSFGWPTWVWWILAGLFGMVIWHQVSRQLSMRRRRMYALKKDEFIEVKEYPDSKD